MTESFIDADSRVSVPAMGALGGGEVIRRVGGAATEQPEATGRKKVQLLAESIEALGIQS